MLFPNDPLHRLQYSLCNGSGTIHPTILFPTTLTASIKAPGERCADLIVIFGS
jgi:hypothetical protein